MSRLTVLAAAALGLGLLAPAGALAGPADQVQEAGERFATKAVEQAAATCRREPLGREECAQVLGTPDASPAAVAAHEASETARSLRLQRALGDRLPLVDGLWIGTHNSFNSTSESPTLSQSDSNQQLSLTDQLRLDVRSLELDAHWWPSLPSAGPPAGPLPRAGRPRGLHDRAAAGGRARRGRRLAGAPREQRGGRPAVPRGPPRRDRGPRPRGGAAGRRVRRPALPAGRRRSRRRLHAAPAVAHP